MADYQLEGVVVWVDRIGNGPVVRSSRLRVAGIVVHLVVLPAVLIALAILRLVWALTGSITGVGGRPREHIARASSTSVLRRVVSGLTVRNLMSAGKALITDARIRDSIGDVYAVRFQGQFVSGSIALGDTVTLLLEKVGDVLVVQDGRNNTTNARIRLVR